MEVLPVRSAAEGADTEATEPDVQREPNHGITVLTDRSPPPNSANVPLAATKTTELYPVRRIIYRSLSCPTSHHFDTTYTYSVLMDSVASVANERIQP